jgi:carbamoyltransferase
VLGINRTQDASACLMQGSRLLWAIQKERLTRHKHHWGKPGDIRDHYGPRLPWPECALDIVVECFSSDDGACNLARYDEEPKTALRLAPVCRHARISHHLAHLYGAFHPSSFREAAVMVIDGQGSPVAELTDHWREVASFYRGEGIHTAAMGLFRRNGTVFSAGTTDWAQVLDAGRDRQLERITRNVLDGLLRQ